MQILTLGNELLRHKAQPVKKIGPEYINIAEELIRVLSTQEGIGLAGPQVGRMERIFAVHVGDDVPRIFINPSIIETSQETEKLEEGCLSIPGIYTDAIRPKTVIVQGALHVSVFYEKFQIPQVRIKPSEFRGTCQKPAG